MPLKRICYIQGIIQPSLPAKVTAVDIITTLIIRGMKVQDIMLTATKRNGGTSGVGFENYITNHVFKFNIKNGCK